MYTSKLHTCSEETEIKVKTVLNCTTEGMTTVRNVPQPFLWDAMYRVRLVFRKERFKQTAIRWVIKCRKLLLIKLFIHLYLFIYIIFIYIYVYLIFQNRTFPMTCTRYDQQLRDH